MMINNQNIILPNASENLNKLQYYIILQTVLQKFLQNINYTLFLFEKKIRIVGCRYYNHEWPLWLSNLPENPQNQNYFYVIKYKYLAIGWYTHYMVYQ